jgi:DNA-binding NarL/FixJ family response regulator
LLDLRLPYMSGDKFLEKLRKMPEFELTPVIILTNVSRNEAPRTIWHLNIAGYFVKAHHTPTELVKIVDSRLDGLSRP